MNPAFSTTRPAPAGSPPGLTIRPLSRTVAESMEQYFRALEGHAPKNLYDEILAQIEPPLLNATLRYCRGNQSRAAEMLGLNRATLRKKLAQYAIRAGEHKG